MRRAVFALIALLVAIGFLVRRTGLRPDGGEAFDPADYRDVPRVEAHDAAGFVGQRAVVRGRVVNAVFASSTGGQPTFLNVDRAYPDQPFDVVVWGRDRSRFEEPPEVAYLNEKICVAGRVDEHEGVPRIEVRVPEQIRETGSFSRP